MKKLAAPSFVAVLCALALVSSSAGSLPLPAPSSQPASALNQLSAGLAPATEDDAGAAATADVDTQAAAAQVPSIEQDFGQDFEQDSRQPLPAAQTSDRSLARPADGTPAPEAAAAAPAAVSVPSPEPAATGEAATVPPSSGAAGNPATEVPSIPPLWAPDAELGQATGGSAHPELGVGSAAGEPGMVESQALLGDSNAAAILTVFNKINEYRVSRGLTKVKYHATVAGMAQEWSDSIASREVIEHRASFWTDSRALRPNNGAGEVIAIRTDRDAAGLVEWWKGSPGHNAMLLDPRFNVMGAGITYTDRLYQIWGVVNFFGYTTLPAGTTDSPSGGSNGGGGALPAPPQPTVCDAPVKHMPPTLNLSAAAITGPGDLVTVDAGGQLVGRSSLGGRNYAAPRIIGSGFSGAKEVFTPDWDRDGTYDLLTQWTNGNLTLHRGIAAGGFQAPVTLGAGGWNTLSLAVGTWCANNRMPQILALDPYGNLFLYPNKGLGDLSARVTVATGVHAAKVSMVDFDGDGFQDLLGLRTDGSVQLYRGMGTTALRAESRPTVATGWGDVTGFRPVQDVTALNSRGLALRRGNDTVQYWDLTSGSLTAPSNIAGSWSGSRLAQ